ncbi:hypothetical protein ACOMHN_013750 [Nucella lapillus]
MACPRFQLIPPASDSECPVERSGHRVLVDDHDANLYVLGGYNPNMVSDLDVDDEQELNKCIFVELWRFNLFSRQWQQITMTGDFPRYLASHSASLHGKTLLTFGGSGIPFGVRSSNSLHMCQLEPGCNSVHWIRLPFAGPQPQRKYGQCQLYQWPYMYIVGGTTGFVYNSDVHRYDMRVGVWTCLWDSQTNEEGSPTGRYRHEMVLHNQQLLMFGGGQATCCFNLNEVPAFDLETEKWKSHQTTPDMSLTNNSQIEEDLAKGFPPARRCHSCIRHDNAVYVFGGRGLEAFGDLWRLCLNTFHWTCLKKHQLAVPKLYFHGAAITSSGSMYVFGGVTYRIGAEPPEFRTNSIFKVQLAVPPLQELVWDYLSGCLRAYLPSSPSLPLRLLDAGVPRQFINRLSMKCGL